MPYAEDGLIREWSLEKLDLLRRYLPSFTRACKRARECYYIDGFAGPGYWRHPRTGALVPGSPAVALATDPPFTKCFFVEAGKARAQVLKEQLRSDFPNREFEVYQGRCHEVMPSILKEIDKRSPTFVFLDPSGPHHAWSTNVLLSHWKTELFLPFPYPMAIPRLMPRSGKISNWANKLLNFVYGPLPWWEIYQEKVKGKWWESTSKFVEVYLKGLRELGYPHVLMSGVLKNQTHQPLYYLIWVGKHPAGKTIMSHVLGKAPGQLRWDFFYEPLPP